MEILTMGEYQSLTDTPKEIRGHLFSISEKEIISFDGDDYGYIVGYDISFCIDGKLYKFYQNALNSAYYTFTNSMGKVFETL